MDKIKILLMSLFFAIKVEHSKLRAHFYSGEKAFVSKWWEKVQDDDNSTPVTIISDISDLWVIKFWNISCLYLYIYASLSIQVTKEFNFKIIHVSLECNRNLGRAVI